MVSGVIFKGLYLNIILRKIDNSLVFKIIEVIIVLAFLYLFIFVDRMYEEMLYLTAYKNFNNDFLIIDLLKKIIISLGISLITYNVKKYGGNEMKKMLKLFLPLIVIL